MMMDPQWSFLNLTGHMEDKQNKHLILQHDVQRVILTLNRLTFNQEARLILHTSQDLMVKIV